MLFYEDFMREEGRGVVQLLDTFCVPFCMAGNKGRREGVGGGVGIGWMDGWMEWDWGAELG